MMDKRALFLSIVIYGLVILLTMLVKFSPFTPANEYISIGFVSEEAINPQLIEGTTPAGGTGEFDTFTGDVPVKIKEPKPGLPPEDRVINAGKEVGPEGYGGEEKGYRIQGEIATRKLIRFVKPVYPSGEHEETDVKLEVTVDSLGYVKKVDVIKTGGYRFDRSAMEAVREWRFMPLRGIPEQKGIVIILYRLKK